MINERTFYSNGNLITEYLVLDGATAFALPTKFGQIGVEKTLIIKFTGKALTLTQIWFEKYFFKSK
jgi:hypothetical protein